MEFVKTDFFQIDFYVLIIFGEQKIHNKHSAYSVSYYRCNAYSCNAHIKADNKKQIEKNIDDSRYNQTVQWSSRISDAS